MFALSGRQQSGGGPAPFAIESSVFVLHPFPFLPIDFPDGGFYLKHGPLRECFDGLEDTSLDFIFFLPVNPWKSRE